MMKSYLSTLLCSLCCVANLAWAKPADETVRALNASVLRVTVNLPNGKQGLGSAVVIAKNEVITNCHVVTDASDVSVIVQGVPHKATAIKADWHHDLCMLTVEDLDAPIVRMGASKTLQYETALFTIGYPDETKSPVNTYGVVKELFPMDGSVIIRATSSFRLGASGGGAFDDAGNLIGIITLKSRGDSAYYYYMPVEWVQNLMRQPAQALGSKSEKPFWAMDVKQRPYFMQVVQPYLSQEWSTLLKVASQWVENEPDTAESWFYLAAAEYAVKDFDRAEVHFKQVLALNDQHSQAQHSQAMAYLAKLAAEKYAKAPLAHNQVAMLR